MHTKVRMKYQYQFVIRKRNSFNPTFCRIADNLTFKQAICLLALFDDVRR